MLGSERLGRIDVENRTAQLAGPDGLTEGVFIDDAAPRHVDDDRAGGEPAEGGGIDHPLRLAGERCVDGEDGRPIEKLIERRRAPHAQRLATGIGNVRIIGHDRHPKRVRACGDLTAYASQPHNAERLSHELASEEERAVPSAGAHQCVCLREMSEEANDGAEEQLGHGDRVACGCVDGDAELSGEIDVNVIRADPRSTHDRQARRRAQQLG